MKVLDEAARYCGFIGLASFCRGFTIEAAIDLAIY